MIQNIKQAISDGLAHVGNIPQNTRVPIDAVAVAAGFAVWAQHVPLWVGIFTIAWLGMQILIHLPRLLNSLKQTADFFKKCFKKES